MSDSKLPLTARRRALNLLSVMPDGCTEAVMRPRVSQSSSWQGSCVTAWRVLAKSPLDRGLPASLMSRGSR